MKAHDREVAGIRCTQVLELLSDYVDGQLDAVQLDRIRSHLRGCDWCEKFGGEFAAAVAALRTGASTAPDAAAPADPALRRRLDERLGREIGGSG